MRTHIISGFILASSLLLCSCNDLRINGNNVSDATSRERDYAEQNFKQNDNWQGELKALPAAAPTTNAHKNHYHHVMGIEMPSSNSANLPTHFRSIVTVNATSAVPAKDLLLELARKAKVNVNIANNVTGGVTLSAYDTPFIEAVSRICDLAGLRYSIQGNVLHVEDDAPTMVNYRFNILNLDRTSSGEVNVNTDLGTDSTGSGTNTGSKNQIKTSTTDSDFWSTVEAGVRAMLQSYGDAGDEADAATQAARVSINRAAGIISVFGNAKTQRAVKRYLDATHASHSAQVIIEAKVVEVALNDRYRTGVDWNLINSSNPNVSVAGAFNAATAGTAGTPVLLNFATSELFGISENTTLNPTVQLLEEFGVTKTISSPRLHAMNNQHAVLSFAQNYVYFDLNVERETQSIANNDTTSRTNVESEIKTVPIGVILSLHPSIDVEKNEVLLNIRPSLSRITEERSDPGVEIVAAQIAADNNGVDVSNITSLVPVVEVRELDSVARLKDNEIIVIGGLIEERMVNQTSGVPGVSRLPFVGNAFRSTQKNTEMVETVIFLKANIVPGGGVSVEDKAFYERFMQQRADGVNL